MYNHNKKLKEVLAKEIQIELRNTIRMDVRARFEQYLCRGFGVAGAEYLTPCG